MLKGTITFEIEIACKDEDAVEALEKQIIATVKKLDGVKDAEETDIDVDEEDDDEDAGD